MKIVYEDDYGVEQFISTTNSPPIRGDYVIIANEEWVVDTRTFYPSQDTVVVALVQALVKESAVSLVPDARHNELSSAIIDIRSKQEANDKKYRSLTDQVSSMNTYLKSQQRKT